MEETVGKLWHRFITRAAGGHFPQAAVRLKDIERMTGVFFRALGGDPGLRVAAATADVHGARRSLLSRIAGSDERLARARMDSTTLRLPMELDALPERSLNRDLYLWLAALAAAQGAPAGVEDETALAQAQARLAPLPEGASADAATLELRLNQLATLRALLRWPGLQSRYDRLVAAVLKQRPDPARLPPVEAERENLVRQALRQPGSVAALPPLPPKGMPHQPVLLWLGDLLPGDAATARGGRGAEASANAQNKRDERETERQAHRVERVDQPQEKHGLLMIFRAESLLSVAEFLKVKRSTDDDPDDNAADAAANLEQLALSRDEERVASKVRFDLDLPSAAEDDVVLGGGIPLPEWDYRKQLLREDHVRLQEFTASPHDPRAAPTPLPAHLRRTARHLHRQFAALQPGRRWLKGRIDGSELDLDAVVRAATDRAIGQHPSDQLYLSLEKRERDLACLALADLSLSTDAWISSEARVIDVIRDSLLLFGEALSATGDGFALCGFSSVKRSNVRFHRLKDFSQRFDDAARGRIMAIKPGYYTRLGAAIRHATSVLEKQAAARRVLLILSDGKPNDLDLYDGRYGIEDTRVAVIEARGRGIVPFCVTIDREGASYLPHLFGPGGYAVIREPDELPARLPMFYAQLTR
ncbi:nitric oxide reductase activation protein NorD [Thauera linaloolentis]|uniref:von Willebrand factor type A n=1 Tax=Thauera linaloolentis (strain DSM 12138 / JCM 21573 / CCUG 41526 / CIP 105981 / IAM 15112 / NBRC 102519 / 47Lol) TaxID=1123367 RepID=N6Z6H9_THAL4|nr:VWA domain-containing protein [Thauera linaloolentis]ENO89958.1 von Willebrand factor type A [Thauera linaloolentis 47Lol = DSM 12138]MCM8566615.1 VWA domain-containing protein [Thauera linaloolentis]